MTIRLGLIALMAGALFAGGCESHIRPLRPVQQMEVWVPDEPTAATAPATEPGATAASGPATAATTLPATTSPEIAAATSPDPLPATTSTAGGHMVTRMVDPNQTSRFIYKAGYDNIWQQAMTLLNKTGFALDRRDYRLGVLTTEPLPSAQLIELWKPQHVNALDATENTINTQRRRVRITIAKVPEKPDFYEIGVQVLVERQTNPGGEIGGPIFVEGSGFGRNAITLRSDYAPLKPEIGAWVTLGHDPDLEKKLIEALFQHI